MRLRVEEKAVPQHTRASNRRLILQLLFRSNSSYSRADLARITGLTPASVSSVVGALIEEGIVGEGGFNLAKVGKPSVKLALNDSAFSSVCVELSSNSELRVVIMNLNGDILFRSCRDISGNSGEEIIELMDSAISAAISKTQGNILGIGVSIPGIVSPSGKVIEASNFGLIDCNLAEDLQDRFNLPVVVANDANAAVLAEYSYADLNTQNIIAITIGRGVGAGIILNGNLYLGEAFAAGEIGHVAVEDDGPICRCGNRGCLETFLSSSTLQAAVFDGTLLEVIGQRLGRVLASIVSLLDIHNIVIAETGITIQNQLCEIAFSTLKKSTLTHLNDTVSIQPSVLGKDVALLGANLLIMNHVLGIV